MNLFKLIKYEWISLKNIHKSGLLVPTSKATIELIVNNSISIDTKIIVELGAGNGNITKGILKKMPATAKLFSFEISSECIEFLQEIKDERLIIINDSAEKLNSYLEEYGYRYCDVIISTLPFSVFDYDLQQMIIIKIKNSLINGGVLVQMRYFSWNVLKLLNQHFGTINTKYSLINLPPTFLHFCKKNEEVNKSNFNRIFDKNEFKISV